MNVGRSQAVLRRTATTSGEFWTRGLIGVASYRALGAFAPPLDFQKNNLLLLYSGAIQSTTAISYSKYLQDFASIAQLLKIAHFSFFFDTNENSTGLYVTRYV